MFSLDRSLFFLFYNFGKSLGANWLFIFFATYLPILITLAFLFLLYKKGGDIKRKIYFFGFTFLGIVISRGGLTEVIRYFFPRIRPFIELNLTPMLVDRAFSFPSGHTTFLFMIAFSAFLIDKKWGWILSLTSLLAVLSRVVAGVHWPSDIVGGIIIAGTVFVVMYYWVLPPKKIILAEDKQEILLPNA
jgi:undecaprenyl-diphosphatase